MSLLLLQQTMRSTQRETKMIRLKKKTVVVDALGDYDDYRGLGKVTTFVVFNSKEIDKENLKYLRLSILKPYRCKIIWISEYKVEE
jgi:hypothetical protein